jgi:VanZ family protein
LDKLVHLAIYFIFTLVWFVYFYKATMGKRIVKSLVKASFFAFCAGVSIEILQKLLTKNRSADLNDILANSIGIAIAAVLLYQLQKYNKLNSLK